MSQDVMLHVAESLNPEQRQVLLRHLEQRFGVPAPSHVSEKPHLLFCPADPAKAPPHAVLSAVRAQGYHAHLVDL